MTLFLGGKAIAQSPSQCSADAALCFQRVFEAACQIKLSTISTCDALIAELEPRVKAGEAIATNYLGGTYIALARLSVSNSQISAAYKKLAIEVTRKLVVNHPDFAAGLHSLATLIDDEEEKFKLMTLVVTLEPGNSLARMSLAQLLDARGGSANTLRAGQQLEKAYEIESAQQGGYKWYVAQLAVATYERSGRPDRAKSVIESVRIAA